MHGQQNIKIPCRRFGTGTQKSAVVFYFAAEAWHHAQGEIAQKRTVWLKSRKDSFWTGQVP